MTTHVQSGLFLLIAGASVWAGVPVQPMPVGDSTITVSYSTTGGDVSFSAAFDYSGTLPPDATALGAAPNIRAFNSANAFGRRAAVPGAIAADETLIAHAFFKIDNLGDYFPDLVTNGDITVTISDIAFDVPVAVDPSTFMLHVKWLPDQADQLSSPYVLTDDHHTDSDPFRQFDDFINAGVFGDFPVSNYVLSNVDFAITATSSSSFDLSITFPYSILQNLEETGQMVPGGLPGPQGFLEPFHYHLEYLVSSSGAVPAASDIGLALLSLTLIGFGAVVIRRRRAA